MLWMRCLIAPSMQDRIVEAGEATPRLEHATTVLAGWALLPFIASLGLGLFIVFERIFGRITGFAVGVASAALAGFFWFGLAWLIRARLADQRTKETDHDRTIRPDAAFDESRANADRGPDHHSRLSGTVG